MRELGQDGIRERDYLPTVTSWGAKGQLQTLRNMDCSSEAVIKLPCLGPGEFFSPFKDLPTAEVFEKEP